MAALVISWFGHMSPGKVQAFIGNSADPQPCPDALPPGYENFTRPAPPGVPPLPQECQGGRGNNAWYGGGQVNAFSALRA